MKKRSRRRIKTVKKSKKKEPLDNKSAEFQDKTDDNIENTDTNLNFYKPENKPVNVDNSSSDSENSSSDSLATGESELLSSEVESGEVSSSSDSDVEMVSVQSAPQIYKEMPQVSKTEQEQSDGLINFLALF